MSDLSKKILSLFRGRHDYIAVGEGAGFGPSKVAPSDALIEQHLAGQKSYGFYVMTADSKVHCTCVDFDNKPEHPNPDYENQAVTLYAALRSFDLRPLLERSQSGSGYHVWLFFAAPVDAYIARAWWHGVEARMKTTFKEVFPKQDRLTEKKMGNLVRYPLWGKSCFIEPEEDMRILDPNEALSEIQRLAPEDLPMLAHQLGMGTLRPEPSTSVIVGSGGDGMLPLRVQKLLDGRPNSFLSRRWGGDSAGMKDPSNSAIAMSIAVELVRLYVPTPEIASGLRYWCRQRGTDKGERNDWIDLTVTKAYDFITTREEKVSATDSTFEKACLSYIDLLERGALKVFPSGMAELDRSIDGAGPGEMVVVAARPGHGKSAFAFQWLQHVSSGGTPALIISEEMSAVEIGKRRLLSVSTLPQEHWGMATAKALRVDVAEFHKGVSPVHIVEGCNTIDRVEEVVEQFVKVHGAGFVAVDYLQLLTGRNKERYEVVTEMSRRLKQCAHRNNVPIIVLSQLNRAVEGRQDNEPRLSDLRESGQIEQDADLILFLQWPNKFDANIDPGEYRIICAKRRNGPIRQAKMVTRFNPARQIIGLDSERGYEGG